MTIDYASGESGYEGGATAPASAESTGTDSDNSSNNQIVEEPTPEPTPDAGDSRLVWKTATGSKYHSHNSCGRTNPANATQITEAEAQALGLEACSKCF